MRPNHLEKLILALEAETAALARAIAVLKAQRPTPARRVVTKIADRSTT